MMNAYHAVCITCHEALLLFIMLIFSKFRKLYVFQKTTGIFTFSYTISAVALLFGVRIV